MRPLLLKMKAFGSYAKETVVNFNDLDKGLYLITGDTGAGKTTIFDAMVFALFCEASGTGRDYSMFHSDYVSKSEDTIVQLTFEHNNKEYLVERKLHCAKKRDGSYDVPKPSSLLYEEDKLPIENNTNVTKRIIEILGLDANQFRQIIVLAQGEFQKFLQADGKQRNEILGKLFDNSPYVRFQTRLKKASEKIDKCMEEDKNAIRILMSNFKYPNESDQLMYHYSNPMFIENIDNLINEEKIVNDNLNKSISDILKERSNVEVAKQVAINTNKSLDELRDIKLKVNDLEGKKEYYINLNSKLERVELACKIVPFEKSYLEALKRYDSNKSSLLIKKDTLSKVSVELQNALNKYNEVNILNDKKVALMGEKERLLKVLDIFKPYHEAKNNYETVLKTYNELIQEINNLKIKNDKLELEVSQNKIKQAIIKETTDKEAERLLVAKKCNDKYQLLVQENGLIDMVNTINKKLSLLQEYKQDTLKLTHLASEYKSKYDLLYDRFIKSQAALLTKELKKQLDTNKTAICPVCHNHLIKSDLDHLNISDDIITQEEVDIIKNQFDDADNKRIEAQNKVNNLNVLIQSLKENVMSYVTTMELDISSYDKLTVDYIDHISSLLKLDKEQSEQDVLEVQNAKKRLNRLVDELTKIENNIITNNDSLKNKNELASDMKAKISSLETTITNLLDSFKGLSEQQTKDKLNDIVSKLKEINEYIEVVSTNLTNIQNKYNNLNGEVKTLMDNDLIYQEELNSSKKNFNDKLVIYNFDNIDEYHELININDIDKWIISTREQINQYKLSYTSSHDYLQRQLKVCEDKEYIDLEKIDAQLTLINNKYNLINKEKDDNNALLKSHEDIIVELRKRQSSIEKYIPASIRLKNLSDIANGYSSDGGKLSFDRYVMGNAFADILKAANIHLSIMTGGQYELIHQTKAHSKVATAGLDIEVLDAFTQERRKPDSLSGGEKFQVSMALALGLSDVVQNYAGGKRIESMYIDEGFGSLDETILDKAIEVLRNIARDTRQIGIISHVSRLEESISQKIIVKKTDNGSVLTIQK